VLAPCRCHGLSLSLQPLLHPPLHYREVPHHDHDLVRIDPHFPPWDIIVWLVQHKMEKWSHHPDLRWFMRTCHAHVVDIPKIFIAIQIRIVLLVGLEYPGCLII